MVFKLFRHITNLFKSQPKVTFTFFSDPKDIVKIFINYHSLESPEYIASLIYALNSGLFLDKIINAILENKNKDFSSDILSKLDMLYILDSQDNILIKPLQAFDKNVK